MSIASGKKPSIIKYIFVFLLVFVFLAIALFLAARTAIRNHKFPNWREEIGNLKPYEAVYCEIVYDPTFLEYMTGQSVESAIADNSELRYINDDGDLVQIITWQAMFNGLRDNYLKAVNNPYVDGLDKIEISEDYRVISIEAAHYFDEELFDLQKFTDIVTACMYLQVLQQGQITYYADTEIIVRWHHTGINQTAEADMISYIKEELGID